MVSSNLRGVSENLNGDFRGYATRDRTGNDLYSVYEKDGFYHFYNQDGKNLHTHSVRMGLSTEGFSPCEKDGTKFTRETRRQQVLDVL